MRAVQDHVLAIRRDLHRHPELSWEEHRTQRTILETLHQLGLDDVRPVAKTGVTGLVRGSSAGPCVLWRADIDALPIPERSDLPFRSKVPGAMHACGHDAHVAIALGIAEVLAARRRKLRGSVKFLFQPAEEHAGGAQACVADGVLEHPHVDRVLGLHISADVPLGSINVAPGPFFAAPTFFCLAIQGKGGHGAAPQQAVDAVVVAAHVVTALQTVVSRSIAPLESALLTVGTIQAGYRANVIAEQATMEGTIRTYTDPTRAVMLRRTEDLVRGICAAFGATYTFEHNTSCPPLVNDEQVTAMVAGEAEQFFGPGTVHAVPSMGADDMSVLLQERPGCYFWLGARNEAKGIAGRHHDPGFVIDEDALILGVEFGLRLIERSLEELATPE